MAHKNKVLKNKVTGETFTFLETAKDTDGKRLVFNFSVAPQGKLPVVHLHPSQTETFEIQKGEFYIKIGNELKELKAGDTFTIAKGVPHQWWNPSDSTSTEMKVTFEPALNTEIFFEQWCGLCNDDKIQANGQPAFLQIMAMSNIYELYIAGPPLPIQKAMGFLLGGVAKLLGFKGYYPQYSE